MSDKLKLEAKPMIEHPTPTDHPGGKPPEPDCCTAPPDDDPGPPKG